MKYTISKIPARSTMTLLARQAKNDLISIEDATTILRLSSQQASARLAYLAKKGWLQRARRGTYYIVPLSIKLGEKTMSNDPWVLAQKIFTPCYIGGWSALSYWGLTEQIFPSTLTITTKRVRQKRNILLGHVIEIFQVKKITPGGIISIWREDQQVRISSPERAIVDSAKHPELCGGISQLSDIIAEYSHQSNADQGKIITIARACANGAAWKRLGYLTEQMWPQAKSIIKEARRHLSQGYSKLSPSSPKKTTISTKWKLWININPTYLYHDS